MFSPERLGRLYEIVWCLLWTAAAKSLQSCPTLWDPIDGSPLGSPVPGILQARTLGWVAISFSNAWKWKVKVKSLSHVWLLVTPWIAAYQAPLSMGFSRQGYWSGVPSPSLLLWTGYLVFGRHLMHISWRERRNINGNYKSLFQERDGQTFPVVWKHMN